MKSSYSSRSLFVLILALLLFLAPHRHCDGTEGSSKASGPSISEPDLRVVPGEGQMYWGTSNCCGLVAVYMVAADLGQPLPLKTIASGLPVGAKGTSMDSMQRFFEGIGLKAVGVEINAEDLYRLLKGHPGLHAVVQVRPEHWVMVSGVQDGAFRAYWYPEWTSLRPDEMTKMYKGFALLVDRHRDFPAYLSGEGSLGLKDWGLLSLLLVQSAIVLRLLKVGARGAGDRPESAAGDALSVCRSRPISF